MISKTELPENTLRLVSQIKHIALDMDGTIYKGDTLFPFTNAFLARLTELNISYSFLTNNPSKSTDDYLAHLAKMGVTVSREQMYTSAQATIDYLKRNMPKAKRLFLLGTPSMISEFEKDGFISSDDSPSDIPDAVVVAFDKTLTYSRLCRATWWVAQGVPYIATNPDSVCPTDLQVVLVDCGAICAAIEKATNRKPDVVIGKPDASMLNGIVAKHGLQPEQIAMVGDRIYTDIKMAENAGAVGVLVLSGEATLADVEQRVRKPDIVVENIELLGELLAQASVQP